MKSKHCPICRFLLSLSFFLLLANGIHAQRSVSGVIIDFDDGAPTPYVSIFIKERQSHGVISNEEGAYRLVIPPEYENGEIVFSSLGYQTIIVPIRTIKDSTHNVRLLKSFIALDEVVVISDLGLRTIVERAIENIPNVYGSDKHYLETYFRRYTLTDGRHSHIKEGFITIQDGEYKEKPGDFKIWMQHYRESDDFRRIKFLDDRPGMNFIFNTYRWYNALKRHTLHFMSSKNRFSGDLNNYTFSNKGTYLEKGDSLIRIAYNLLSTPEVNKYTRPESYYLYEGELLINLNDYAIVRNTMGQGMKDYFQDMIYIKKDGKYYPQKFHFLLELAHGHGGSHQINTLFYFYNIINDRKAETVKKGRRLSAEIPIESSTVKYDPAFWAKDNTLLKMDLPSALEMDLNRMNKLDEQYRRNSKKVNEE